MTHDEIRMECFRDEELRPAIDELFSSPGFVQGMKAFLPAELSDLILREKDTIDTIYDFQKKIISPFLHFIEQISIRELSASGLDGLSRDDKYLFISNHRDIVLDSAFLNLVLFENGFTTSRIAIGDNLMKNRISELLFRINKSFVVKRTGTPRELYTSSLRLSAYIRDSILGKEDSVWIAQREGRAKDGDDRTQIGVLKMLSLSGEPNLKEHFRSVKIVPVSISYEYDPCGLLKTREFLNRRADPGYRKSFQEDVAYILAGLRGVKGHVHFQFGKPLDEELDMFGAASTTKKQLELLAGILDRAIHLQYRLHPVNYVACDLLGQSGRYAHLYTLQDRERIRAFFDEQLASLHDEEREAGREYLLRMYANPVINAAACMEE